MLVQSLDSFPNLLLIDFGLELFSTRFEAAENVWVGSIKWRIGQWMQLSDLQPCHFLLGLVNGLKIYYLALLFCADV